MFDYYCHNFGFDCVEINSSFYRPPAAKSMASLASRSPENFHFMVKVFHGFTHNLREATPKAFRTFHQGIAPLAQSGKLCGLLAQFPPAFMPGKESRDWLQYLRKRFAPFPLFIEFRHPHWGAPENFDFLKQEDFGYCMADLPDLDTLPSLAPAVTNGIAYVRFHGRNREWYRPTTSRYDYQYSDEELRSVLDKIGKISPPPSQAFIFFNNCHAGVAVRSAKRCLALSQQLLTSGSLM